MNMQENGNPAVLVLHPEQDLLSFDKRGTRTGLLYCLYELKGCAVADTDGISIHLPGHQGKDFRQYNDEFSM